MTDLRAEMSALRIEISKLAVALAALPTRSDFNAELDKRVDRSTYEVAHRGLEAEMRLRDAELSTDIKNVEADLNQFRTRAQGSMQRLVPWLALGAAILFGSLSTIVSVVALMWTIFHTH